MKPLKKKGTKKSISKKPKRKEVEFEIKLKGDDGQVTKYTEADDDELSGES
jgi:hypothetical protein